MKVQHDKVWFTSDLHFWHKNICKYCDRPYKSLEEMHEAIIANWNSVVQDDDDVFLLGDMGFCSYAKLKALITRLKGRIHLIQGNHDEDKVVYKLYDYDNIYSVNKLLQVTVEGDEECPNQELTLCHFPMIDWYNKERGAWMIHGHQHQLPHMTSCSTAHWDIGLDRNNMFPVSFEQLKINITKQFVNNENKN